MSEPANIPTKEGLWFRRYPGLLDHVVRVYGPVNDAGRIFPLAWYREDHGYDGWVGVEDDGFWIGEVRVDDVPAEEAARLRARAEAADAELEAHRATERERQAIADALWPIRGADLSDTQKVIVDAVQAEREAHRDSDERWLRRQASWEAERAELLQLLDDARAEHARTQADLQVARRSQAEAEAALAAAYAKGVAAARALIAALRDESSRWTSLIALFEVFEASVEDNNQHEPVEST
jgi:hypothetical protein